MGCRKLNILKQSGNPDLSGSKNYESVLTVVGKSRTTEKLQVEHFLETKKMGVNYYPFGSLMPGRYSGGNQYRYGFGGMEMDNEVNSITGSSYTAEFWQYDSRLGKRWNVDPKVKPHESPYAVYANNPIWFVDPNGADTLIVHRSKEAIEHGKAKIYTLTFSIIQNGVQRSIAHEPMWMMANKDHESKGDNDLHTFKFYKLTQDYMSHDSKKDERTIRVNKWGVFIHNGNWPSSFAGCFGVSCMSPIYDEEMGGKVRDVTLLGTGDKMYKSASYAKYINSISADSPDIKGGLKALWDLYDLANGGVGGTQLTGDKFLLQPNSESKVEKLEKIASKKVTTLYGN